MQTEQHLGRLAHSLGADYFGIADLSSAREFIQIQGGERVARYPRAIAIGIRLQDSLVDLLLDKDSEGAMLYRHNSYDVVNLMLDQIGVRIANELQRAGHSAFPVPASRRTDDENICGIVSQKLAAHLAGLGWIGKSCLLITPDHGPSRPLGQHPHRCPAESDRNSPGTPVRRLCRVCGYLPAACLYRKTVLPQ